MEVLPRWRVFPREIEADLDIFYSEGHINDWHAGRMSSRKLLIRLDRLMLEENSWYRHSVQEFLEELKAEEERKYKHEVHSMIFAQLTGQKMGD